MTGEKVSFFKIDKKNYLPILLVVITLFGLVCKLLLSFNTDLNSDSVVPGLQAMEIFKHGDILLSSFNFPINYPGIFTDLVPFHLIPQLLTNYDPDALKLTGFLIFVLILAVYTSIIYKVSKDQVKALFFMALLGNLTPSAYYFFAQPVAHSATVLFTGILLFVILDHEKMPFYEKALIAVVVFLIAFSDNLALAIIAIPFTLVLIYTRIRMNRMTPWAAVIPAIYLFLPALAAYVIKLFLPRMVTMDITLVTAYSSAGTALGSLPDNILHYVGDTLSIFNDQLYAILNQKIGLFEILSLALVIMFVYSMWNIGKGYKKDSNELKLFLLILLVSNALLFLGYILTSLNAARYLLFTSLALLAIVSLGYDNSKIYLALATIVIILGAIACAVAVSHLNYQPNKTEYELINYLEENSLNVGYSDYWDANIITYLSNEKIKVRAVGYKNKYMVPYKLLSSSKWYEYRPTKFFLLYHINHYYGNIGAIASAIGYDRMVRSGDYYIFIYDMDESPLITSNGA